MLQLQRSRLLVWSSQLCVWWETPFKSSPQNGARNLYFSLHRLWQVFNFRLYLVMSLSQLTLSLSPISRPLPGRPFRLSFFHPIRNRCRFAAYTFLLLARASLIILCCLWSPVPLMLFSGFEDRSRTPNIIGISFTFIFHGFFSSLAKSMHLILFHFYLLVSWNCKIH